MLRADNVSLAYGGGIVVHDATLMLDSGEMLALVGANGAGKTTLLRGLAGLHRATAGRISLDGRPVRAGMVAFVPQTDSTNFAMPMTVADLVGSGCYGELGLLRPRRARHRQRVRDSLEQTGLTALAKRPVRELSRGQRQRALVARCLVHRTALLAADEPLTGVDATSRAWILSLFEDERRAGRSIVFSTHDREEAARADRVLELVEGHVRASPDDPSRSATTPARVD